MFEGTSAYAGLALALAVQRGNRSHKWRTSWIMYEYPHPMPSRYVAGRRQGLREFTKTKMVELSY